MANQFSFFAIAAVITILLLFSVATSQAQAQAQAQTQTQILIQTHIFGPFNYSYYNTFHVMPDATIHLDSLQLTPDSGTNISFTNSFGGAFFLQPFKLWDDDSNGKLISFSTSFLFNILCHKHGPPGEGLAFLIAPFPNFHNNSYGQFLGLTNASTDNKATNQILAVEIDTVKQDFDPDNNHIGLNVNSVRSNVTVPLSPLGFQIASAVSRFHVMWIEYHGDRKIMEVYLAEQGDKDAPIVAKPAKPILSTEIDLKKVVNQVSYFGLSASTGETYALNSIWRWNISIQYFPEKNGNGNALKIGLGVGVPLLVLGVAGFVGLVVWLRRKMSRKSRESDPVFETLKRLPGAPREFGFHELKKASNNFDKKLQLGKGAFGVVYKGTLPEEDLQMAIKKFNTEKMESRDEFLAELKIIIRLRHKHLLQLLGWCHQKGVLLLVYQYMPNGSLDKHIFPKEERSTAPLGWTLRHQIITGVALALNYIHCEFEQIVVHRDIKAHNILLDEHFNACLGDFGLARALDKGKNSYAESKVTGTFGYIAPECFQTGKATRETDVYAFGVVLLEVVCGKRQCTEIEDYSSLVDWVWHLQREGRIREAVDPRLGNDYVAEEAERILKLGLACSHPNVSDRPNMQTIVQIISGSVQVPYVPPRPASVWSPGDLGSPAIDLTETTTTEYTSLNSRAFEIEPT